MLEELVSILQRVLMDVVMAQLASLVVGAATYRSHTQGKLTQQTQLPFWLGSSILAKLDRLFNIKPGALVVTSGWLDQGLCLYVL